MDAASAENLKKVSLAVPQLLLKLFTRVWKVKYHHIHLFADLLSGLAAYHEDFVISVIDNVLEQVRYGMEDLTNFKFHQRRVMTIKYVGELFNYRMLTSQVIFDILS